MMKTLTIAGKRYRLTTRSYDALIAVTGPGVYHVPLPEGVSLDSPDLRERVVELVERQRENHRRAGEYVPAARRGRQGMNAIDLSIAHWETLAKEEEQMAEIDARAGHNTSVNHNRLKEYRRAAQALRLQKKDGIPRCVCCLKPLGSHA